MSDLPMSGHADLDRSSSAPVRIAIDAMGGDSAPGVEVEGAIGAVRESAGALEVVLVGREGPVAQGSRRK